MQNLLRTTANVLKPASRSWRKNLNFSIRLQSTKTALPTLTYFPPGPQTSQYPNESVTPLLFVSLGDECRPQGLAQLAKRFASRRYSCLNAAFSILDAVDGATMEFYEKELQDALRKYELTYPPVIVSSGLGSLVAETYISSNRASGLILINPPSSVASLQSTALSVSIPEFNYEPLFPIAMVAVPPGSTPESLRKQHRFGESPDDVDWLEAKDEVDDLEGQIGEWLDQMSM